MISVLKNCWLLLHLMTEDFADDIKNCLAVLESGGLILYPTDTIWGIGCDATNEEAVKKIFALKQRDDSKSLIVLMAEERDIIRYVTQPDLAVFDYLDNTTKPVTVIYEGVTGLAENLLSADGSAGIRLVKDEFCRALIKRFRKPIVSTSANISGEAFPSGFSDISEKIKNGVEYIVQHRRNDPVKSEPSSVIKWNRDGSVTIIRS